LDKCSAEQLLTTAAAVAKLRLRPPGMWLRALTAAVNANLGQFESGGLLEVLAALQKLQRSSSSSSIVPFGRRQLQDRPQAGGRLINYTTTSSSSNGRYVASGSSRMVLLRGGVAHPAGSSAAAQSQQQQQQAQENRDAGQQLQAMFGYSSSSSSVSSWQQQQQSTVASLQELDAAAAEAYSMACLVVLMPEWLQSKLSHWPKHMAAERAASQQQQQQHSLQLSATG
jgi:hypothetical protein